MGLLLGILRWFSLSGMAVRVDTGLTEFSINPDELSVHLQQLVDIRLMLIVLL